MNIDNSLDSILNMIWEMFKLRLHKGQTFLFLNEYQTFFIRYLELEKLLFLIKILLQVTSLPDAPI